MPWLWVEVSGQLHALDVFPLNKPSGIYWISGWVGLEPIWMLWRTKKSCALQEWNLDSLSFSL
jgi:hypothetical protein